MLRPVPSRATVGSVIVLLVAFFFAFNHANPDPCSIALGLPLVFIGILLRFITNSVLRKNQEICRDGLYAFCRHPMYVGTITAATGIVVIVNHPLGLALLAAAIVISIYRLRKEEAFLLANLPGYAEYRREVPAFPTPVSIVRAFGSGRLRQQLSLKQAFLNGEIYRLNLYLPLLLASGLYFRDSGKVDLPGAMLVAGALLSLLVTMASVRFHPVEYARSRADYLFPAVLGLGLLVLAARLV